MAMTLSGDNGVTFNDSSLQAAAASPYVLKNRLINGAMQIWQRGTSFTTTGLYGADRWKMQLVGTTTLSQETSVVPTGSQYAVKWTTGASSSYGQIRQFIETTNLYDLRGQTVTASAQVRCNATFSGNLQFEIGYATTGDASTESYTVISGTSTGTVNSSGYTTITWTGTIPSNTLGLYVGIVPSVVQASGAIAYMGNVQLEIGSTATPFERRLYNQELANCQRYAIRFGGDQVYELIGSGFVESSTSSLLIMPLPVFMRSSPSVSFSTLRIVENNGAAVTVTGVSTKGSESGNKVVFLNPVAASGLTTGRVCWVSANNSTSASLLLSAEL